MTLLRSRLSRLSRTLALAAGVAGAVTLWGAPAVSGAPGGAEELGGSLKAPAEVQFFGAPTSSIASAVGVPTNRAYIWTSGTVPPVVNAAAPAGSPERFGDTRTQAVGTLRNIETVLAGAGLSLRDVVYLRVYLVPDRAREGQVDYQGWFDAYAEFFNNEANPVRVARSTLAVAGLVNSDWLIEIEAVAVYPE